MKTNPWFSTETLEDPQKMVFYHDNTVCVKGSRVEKNHHRYGTDNRPLCRECGKLDADGR